MEGYGKIAFFFLAGANMPGPAEAGRTPAHTGLWRKRADS